MAPRNRWRRIVEFVARHRLLLAVMGAALGVRIALALKLGDGLAYYDERDYHQIAQSVLAGRGFASEHGPTAFRAPAQPVFLALIYAVFGPHPLAARLVQALALTALVPASMRLSSLVSRRPEVPLWTGLLVAGHPGLAYASATLYPVTLTALALTLGLWLGSTLCERGGKLAATFAGLGLGIAGLATPYFAPLGLVAAVLAATRRRLGGAAVVLLLSLAPQLAWSGRNALELGTFSPGTHAGYNLALGANDRAFPRSGNSIEPDLRRAELPDDEASRDSAHRARALAWIREHPGRFAWLAIGRAFAVFDSVGRPVSSAAPTSFAANALGWALLPVVLLGSLGLVLRRRRPAALLTASSLALVVLSAALSIVKPRFRFPCDPALMVFSAATGAHLSRALGRRRQALARGVL